MAQQENPGIFGTVMSYVPGFGGGSTEDHKKTSEQTHEESHKKHTADGTQGVNVGSTGNTGASNTGDFNSGSGVATGKDIESQTGTGYGSGSQGTYTGTGAATGKDNGNQTGTGYGSGSQGNNTGSGAGTGTQESTQPSSGKQAAAHGQYGAQTGGNFTNSETSHQKPNIEYEDDTVGSGDNSQLGGSSTGTHQSGYNPQGGSSQGSGQAKTDNGVRGAPIEGDGVKGYAIGAPVGSGDTERPNAPGDPSGQVSGAHLEYSPEVTDTRDSRGRGTVGKSSGTGDSSFANVKTSDGNGNSTHVMTRTNESHMHSSSTTQL